MAALGETCKAAVAATARLCGAEGGAITEEGAAAAAQAIWPVLQVCQACRAAGQVFLSLHP